MTQNERIVALLIALVVLLMLVGCAACAPGAGVSKDTEGVGSVYAYLECDGL